MQVNNPGCFDVALSPMDTVYDRDCPDIRCMTCEKRAYGIVIALYSPIFCAPFAFLRTKLSLTHNALLIGIYI